MGRRAGWLEIFCDVVVAGSMLVFAEALGGSARVNDLAAFGLAFTALWLAWTGFTFHENRFAVDDLVHRALVAASLVAFAGSSLAAPGVLGGKTQTFSAFYALTQLILLIVYSRTVGSIPETRRLARHYQRVYGAATGVWLAAAFVPAPWAWALWVVGVGIGLSFPLNPRSRELATTHPPDAHHMTERYGLLVLMLLGVAVLGMVSAAGTQHGGRGLSLAALCLGIVFCLWWLYFDDVAGSSIKAERGAPFVWVYSHLPLVLGLAVTTGALRTLVASSSTPLEQERLHWLVAGGLSLSLLALSVIDSVTVRRHAELGDRARVNARLGAAVLCLLLAPIGAALGPLGYVTLTLAPAVALVLFDLMMAPGVALFGTESTTPTAEIARRRLAGEDVPRPRAARAGEALRRGTPSELRQDFYFFFMNGPWSRLVVSLVFAYLAINACFAGLYMLVPGAVNNARPHAFADAFFFSVQTFSTIGFGVLTPATTYANVVVTAEAAVGLLSAALATGLMFAKAARPRSSTLFSKTAVLGTRNGTPVLMFRAGNARGNEVVDATVSVTVLKEEISREGQHMRRMHELRLVRSRSPLFTMSWTIMHEIHEDSPLHGIDWANPKDVGAIVVTLMGHDGTYGQTTYARHVYYPEDVRIGHRFVDVMSQLPDGRMVIDYAKFHDTAELEDGRSLPPG